MRGIMNGSAVSLLAALALVRAEVHPLPSGKFINASDFRSAILMWFSKYNYKSTITLVYYIVQHFPDYLEKSLSTRNKGLLVGIYNKNTLPYISVE